jgi:hypothetical protein
MGPSFPLSGPLRRLPVLDSDFDVVTDIRVPDIADPFYQLSSPAVESLFAEAFESPSHPPVSPVTTDLDSPEDIELLGKVIGQAVYWDLTDTLELTLWEFVRNDTGTAAFMDHVDGQNLTINFRTGAASRWKELTTKPEQVCAMWTVFDDRLLSDSLLDLEVIL